MAKPIKWSQGKADVAQTITMMIEKLLKEIPVEDKTPFEVKMDDRVKKATSVYIYNTKGTERLKTLYENNKAILAVADIKVEKDIYSTRCGLCILFSLLPPEEFAIQHAVMKREAYQYCDGFAIPKAMYLQGYAYMLKLNDFYSTSINSSAISPKVKKEKKKRSKSKKKTVPPTKKVKKLSASAKHRMEQKKLIKKNLASGEFDPTEDVTPTSFSALSKFKKLAEEARQRRDNASANQ